MSHIVWHGRLFGSINRVIFLGVSLPFKPGTFKSKKYGSPPAAGLEMAVLTLPPPLPSISLYLTAHPSINKGTCELAQAVQLYYIKHIFLISIRTHEKNHSTVSHRVIW